ncbi:hypothetical protein V2J09_016770 [Rumex salicifolius]
MVESHDFRRLFVHQTLGGGTVADIVLWRWWSASLLVLISATSLWFLFEYGGYNLFSFFANVLLLLVTILFLWAKSASLLNRPLPPIPDLEISDASVEKVADALRVWINHILSIAREIAVGANLRVLLQVPFFVFCLKSHEFLFYWRSWIVRPDFRVAVSSWVISYIGSFCDLLTFLYIGVLLSLSLPVLYEKYQDPIYQLHKAIQVQWTKIDERVLRRIPIPMYKKKKTQ